MNKEFIMDMLEFILKIASIISSVVAIKLYFVTRRINIAQEKIMRKQILPNLRMSAVKSYKHTKKSNIYDGTYCYIYCNNTSTRLDKFSFYIKENLISSNDIKAFFDEIESRMEKARYRGNVYFTFFDKKLFLILNQGTKKDDYTIAHSNVEITFENCGEAISAIGIESFTIYFNNTIARKSHVKTKGDKNSRIILPSENTKKFTVFFDEITTESDAALCQIPSDTYADIPEEIDLLKLNMSENYLNYSKLELILICWDMYENKTRFKIILEYSSNDGRFVSSSHLLQ